MGTNYTMKIGGQFVNVYGGSLDVQNQIGQRSTGQVMVWTAPGVHWRKGTQVLLYDPNNVLAFSGYVSKDKATKGSRQGTGYLDHTITLMDNCYRADKRYAFGQWLNVSAGQIVKDLYTTILAVEGVTITPTSIATGPTMIEVVYNYNKTVASALTFLAGQAGYWWNIDTNGVLWFQPYTGIPAPWICDGTQVEQDQTLAVTYGNDLYVNRQFVRGGTAERPSQTETFMGNSLTRAFTLSYEVSTLQSITLNSAGQTVGTKGATGDQWYYATGDAVIAQDTGSSILTSGDTLDVTYKGKYPIVALAPNTTLIAQQRIIEGVGTGYVESEFTDTQLTTLPAATQAASARLAHYGSDVTQLEFNTQMPGLMEGQMLTVYLSDFDLIGEQMLINMVEITDSVDGYNIWFHVVAVGSPVEAVQWQTLWQQMLNQNPDTTALSDVDSSGVLAIITNCTLNEVTTSQPVSPYMPMGVPAFVPPQTPLAGTPIPLPSFSVTATETTCWICGPTSYCSPTNYVC
jgi:hypothetical protein